MSFTSHCTQYAMGARMHAMHTPSLARRASTAGFSWRRNLSHASRRVISLLVAGDMRPCEVAQCLRHAHLSLSRIRTNPHEFPGTILEPLAKTRNLTLESADFLLPLSTRLFQDRRNSRLAQADCAWDAIGELRTEANAFV